MSTQQQTLSIVELAVEQLPRSRNFLLGLLETLSDEQLHVRAGGTGNHALWVMGHVAYADDIFVSLFQNEPSCLSEDHAKLFINGTMPSDDPTDYPDRQELLSRMMTARNRLIEWARSLEDDAIWEASPEEIAPIASNAITAIHTSAQHDFFHGGQIATIRASLNMNPVFA
ncbi:MAG: DinB family protein [Gimesia sp.]